MRIQSAQSLKTNEHHRTAYAILALKSHKKSENKYRSQTAAIGLKTIYNKTMSDHTMIFWADKHRARLINDREVAQLELVCTGR